MKKILAFRIDRLGDYIICSNLLYELKQNAFELGVIPDAPIFIVSFY